MKHAFKLLQLFQCPVYRIVVNDNMGRYIFTNILENNSAVVV